MKSILTAVVFLLLLNTVTSQRRTVAKRSPAKKVIVYTTAANTDYRLTQTDNLQFTQMGQPKETQPCVFIYPTKTFQTFIGIGGGAY